VPLASRSRSRIRDRASLARITRSKNRGALIRRRNGVAVLLGAAMLLAACGTAKTAAKTTKATSAKSSTITVGSAYYADSLDPATGESGGDYSYLQLIYDTLINLNASTGQTGPGLATSFGFKAGNDLQFDMTIRQGVKFQDGTPLNANAVKVSLETFLKTQVVALIPSTDIASINVTGPYTLAIDLTHPFASLPVELADRPGMIMSPTALQKYGKGFAEHPVGAGPYSFVSETPENSVTVKAFPSYWNPSAAKLSGITIRYYATPVALYNAVASGAVDVAEDLPGTDFQTAKSNSSLTVLSGPELAFNNIFFNIGVAPLNNVNVRIAFNEALDRSALARVTTEGLGQAATQPYAKGFAFYDSAIGAPYTYDPTNAKKLVAQAAPHGVNLTCYYYPGAEYEVAAPIIVAEEAAVGIHIKTVDETLSEAATAFNINGSTSCLFADWGSGYDPATTLGLLFGSDSYYNGGAQQKGKVNYGGDAEIASLASAVTLSEEKQDVDKVLQATDSSAPWAPLFFKPNFLVLKRSIQTDGNVFSSLGANYRYLNVSS
jgi:peptide/nickel transport system substrate-binding protein